MDALRGGSPEVQEAIFRAHVKASEESGKPLVIHLVKTLDRILHLRKELSPASPWIIHGFRGKPEIVRQLTSPGGSNRIYFSIGEKFNRESVAAIPPDRLLVETDESARPPWEILTDIAAARGESPEKLTETVNTNFSRLFLEKKFTQEDGFKIKC